MTTISASPKIHKHVDACSFPFVNDAGRYLEAGEQIQAGGLSGVTTIGLLEGETGAVDLGKGPVAGFRIYLTAPLAADVMLGDAVYHPVTGLFLGYAIHQLVGSNPKGLLDPVALAGQTSICYLGLPDAGVSSASETIVGIGAVTTILNPSVGLTIIELSPADGATEDCDAILAAFTNMDEIVDGARIKFHNTAAGTGEISKTADVSGDVITFAKNEFVTLQRANGAWVWV